MTNVVVADSSPLIILFKASLEDILPELFEQILIPEAVRLEIEAGPPDEPAKLKLASTPWVTFDVPRVVAPISGLGAGESSVLSTAESLADSKVLIDYAAARRHAKALGLLIVGTGGVLVSAYRARVIDSFDKALDAVIDAGLWIDPSLAEILRQKARH